MAVPRGLSADWLQGRAGTAGMRRSAVRHTVLPAQQRWQADRRGRRQRQVQPAMLIGAHPARASTHLQVALSSGGLWCHVLHASIPAALDACPPHQGQVGKARKAGQEAAGGLGAVHEPARHALRALRRRARARRWGGVTAMLQEWRAIHAWSADIRPLHHHAPTTTAQQPAPHDHTPATGHLAAAHLCAADDDGADCQACHTGSSAGQQAPALHERVTIRLVGARHHVAASSTTGPRAARSRGRREAAGAAAGRGRRRPDTRPPAGRNCGRTYRAYRTCDRGGSTL